MMTVTKKDASKKTNRQNVSYTSESFGQKLVELRNENNLTQAESAEKIGISRNALSMYERCERCPSIDIAVNVANVYNVSLDYLFGTGYKNPKYNYENLYDLGFSEKTLDFLSSEENAYYVDAILSDPRTNKISDILYGFSYKPLINSYETNYVSRLISDLLYCIVVDVLKDQYHLRPISEDEIYELLDAVNSCLFHINHEEDLVHTDYDKYLDCCDTVETELERIKSLLENVPSTDYNRGRKDGFSDAIKRIANGEIKIPLESKKASSIKVSAKN